MLILDKLNPGGRLIIAGDHHQLGPVLRGRYPAATERGFSVHGSLLESLLRTKDGKLINVSNLPFMDSNKLANTVMLYEEICRDVLYNALYKNNTSLRAIQLKLDKPSE